MTVADLIEKLKLMPPDADVRYVWDGEARSCVSFVWLGRGGAVILAGYQEMVGEDESRPANAPSWNDKPYWGTPVYGDRLDLDEPAPKG